MTHTPHTTLVAVVVVLALVSTGVLGPTAGGANQTTLLVGDASDDDSRTVGIEGDSCGTTRDDTSTNNQSAAETDATIETNETSNETGPNDEWDIERDADSVEVKGPPVEYENDQPGIEIDLVDESVSIEIDDELEIDGPDYEIEHEGEQLEVEGTAIDYENDGGVTDVETDEWEIEQSGRNADVEGPQIDYERDADGVEIDLPTGPVEIEIDADEVDIEGPGYEIDHEGDSLEVEAADERAPEPVATGVSLNRFGLLYEISGCFRNLSSHEKLTTASKIVLRSLFVL